MVGAKGWSCSSTFSLLVLLWSSVSEGRKWNYNFLRNRPFVSWKNLIVIWLFATRIRAISIWLEIVYGPYMLKCGSLWKNGKFEGLMIRKRERENQVLIDHKTCSPLPLHGNPTVLRMTCIKMGSFFLFSRSLFSFFLFFLFFMKNEDGEGRMVTRFLFQVPSRRDQCEEALRPRSALASNSLT